MPHELVINSPRLMCCGLTANECSCRREPVEGAVPIPEPDAPGPMSNTDEPGMNPALDHLFNSDRGSVIDRTGQSAPRTAAPPAADPPGYNPEPFGRGLPVFDTAALANNSLSAAERLNVMPTLNGDCDHVFDTGPTDDDEPPRAKPSAKRLGTFDPVANEAELSRVLFGQ